MTNIDVVVITGGSGFLAQHLIREIQSTWVDRVSEIRVVDRRAFQKYLDYPDKIPVKEFIADCTIAEKLIPIFNEATIVFHMAAHPYNFDMYPEKQAFWRDNVDGLKGVISAMIECNVPCLVHTSDAMALVNCEDSQGLCELTLRDGPRKGHILQAYGETKCKAQQLVRASDGQALKNGHTLSTVVVSPSVLYGEGDNWIVPHALRLCKQYGFLLRLGDGTSVLATTYAGNAAHMHLLAADKLRENPKEFGAELFLCTENTRPANYYTFIEPFIKIAGYSVTSFYIPFLTTWLIFFLLELLFTFFYLFFNVKFPHNLPSSRLARLVSAYYYHFNVNKARLVLDYKPKYDPKQAMKRTLEWWQLHYKDCI